MKIDPRETLFVSDMDGTLLGPDAQVSPFTADVIASLLPKGLLFTVATARSWHSAKPALAQLPLHLPAATHNGVHIVNIGDGSIIEGNYFTDEQKQAIEAVFAQTNTPHTVVSLIDGRERISLYDGGDNPLYHHYTTVRKNDPRRRMVEPGDEGALLQGKTFYFSGLDDPKELEHLLPALRGIPGAQVSFMPDSYHETYYWLEVMCAQTSKASGAQRLKELTGAKRLVCFGDNLNDIPMLTMADVGIAMGNALPQVKEAADVVIDSNCNDGVARYILSQFE